ncbi:ATP-dependent DNA helicase RecG [Amnibacterium kyonggiense]|uniref:Probable DNA 3'-5' helicase RecG n=1 Tax=Amnibacterium kyonggiense TaxID=595671 RepID=A0A4R7FST6_9MICO|nr:ATP-dependent DNA helicase RecG [Amnibacterium kyonggiense]TDS80866.1 ATP-dependent DNA helicase RecG [Amnibacterium kyonggiense]
MAGPLDQRLAAVVGDRTAKLLDKQLQLRTVGDLLQHYPRRYVKRGELSRLDALPLETDVTIVAEVLRATSRGLRARRGSMQEVLISDGTGTLSLVFFNQPFITDEKNANALVPGRRGLFSGKVKLYKGMRQLAHPQHQMFTEEGQEPPDPEVDPEGAKRWEEIPLPIYPATAALTTWKIEKAVELALGAITGLDDPMPLEVCRTARLMGYEAALRRIHRPAHDGDWIQAKRTLRFHEAFLLQTALLQRRAVRAMFAATPRTPRSGGYLERFDAALPFTLTEDQRVVGGEIMADLAGDAPMHRLLQGEVASGKTLVALRGMLAVAESGGQSALLAPTEVLAAQHLRSIAKILGPDLSAELMPTLVTGQMGVQARRKAALQIITGRAKIVVGTHALLSDSTEFEDLGLVVVDEQHRFGVEQREVLRRKGTAPHTLVMTATPIPRTVAMTVFGDLETSTIRGLPAGRAPITSHVVPLAEKPRWLPNVWRRAGEEIEQGRQGYVICPAIGADEDEGDLLAPDDAGVPRATVTGVLADLRAQPALAGRRIEALTGRMSGEEKEAVMTAFAEGRIDLLVATTVVEVGVDVANATFMVVLDADRFGVSQLHQLRGRVGRGGLPGLCLLVTHAERDTPALERVEAVAATTDGFALAQADLELRREGDVLGASQSGGRSQLKLLRVTRDGDIIEQARAAAAATLEEDPALDAYPALRAAIERTSDEESRAFLDKS